ncbi:TIGR04423 family type III CRISPR-associated protein [Aliarcobacter skirrowii]|uniref:TIGR04423 family type III CRISPR-associated protein n=1 Tax=Aliarcobacter skirrowii TaxID=28200 RepID=UPI0029BA02E3|nr:TIGR04423 family type III CRISPR-associated protein [Aliarcobacter skirrowii]MDX4050738.1 TIGR04423 family type III CRISPR-associated protein [Aliarcobacter skirrowii]
MKTLKDLQKIYEELKGEFEGYIQISNKKLDYIFSTKQTLPSWEEIHKEKGFIVEACLFDGDRSITIRQINDKYAVIDKKLSDFIKEQKTTQTFLAKSLEDKVNLEAKITQIWEEKEDENCLNIKVLKPTLQLFSGFEKGENK